MVKINCINCGEELELDNKLIPYEGDICCHDCEMIMAATICDDDEYSSVKIKNPTFSELNKVKYRKDPIFGFDVPESCPGIPSEVLRQRDTWKDKAAYDEKAKHLAALFNDNFKQFESDVPDKVKKAGPGVVMENAAEQCSI